MKNRILAHFFLSQVFLITLFFSDSFSQEISLNSRKILYSKKSEFGFVLHTQGWGIGYRLSRLKSGFTYRHYEFEFVGIDHPKETSSYNSIYNDANSFVYGKLNSLTTFRIGTGLTNRLFEKSKQDGVEVDYFFTGGISCGLVKPVYLYIINYYSQYNPSLSIERYDPGQHDLDNIYGKAPFTEGIDKIKFDWGGYLKAGMKFDYSQREDRIQLLEAGIVFDFYSRAIPMMAYNEENVSFLTMYVSIWFGKKKE